jgi:hypothetical protein
MWFQISVFLQFKHEHFGILINNKLNGCHEHFAWFERNKKERVKEERIKREIAIFSCLDSREIE